MAIENKDLRELALSAAKGFANLGGLRVCSRAARGQAEVELGGAVGGAGRAAGVLGQHQEGVVDRRVAQHAGCGVIVCPPFRALTNLALGGNMRVLCEETI